MISKEEIILKSKEFGFEDVGFTTAEPFETHKKFLVDRQVEYSWAEAVGLELMKGTDPKAIMKDAETVIVLMEVYFRQAYPRNMEGHFGRCYLDDDRVTKDGLSQRIKAFRSFLRDNGIDSKVPFNLPHRVAAARAGMGTFGKNCLFYSNNVARQSSWVLPIAVVINQKFDPGEPTLEMGCPDWCRNTCIAACPTRALKGNGTIDPRKCISYLTYFGQDLTPKELREPMGLYIYGCDRCQNVCPRNAAWLASDLPISEKVVAKAKAFDLSALLHMDKPYFESKIWPHMFYMSSDDLWRWKMNVARAMGNTRDPLYTEDLIRGFEDNEDDRVRAMCAWALGRIGRNKAKTALEGFLIQSFGSIRKEVEDALAQCI
ncbi:MAG: epoxyqueuosine reductase [Desulfobacteraceae bacterium]|nr:epoxyqueuosine reductase [Desulfobacteraceae bacterium]MBC2756227.1 epoxyqueuosine reductase [Desulfobacteraceae bacterium]